MQGFIYNKMTDCCCVSPSIVFSKNKMCPFDFENPQDIAGFSCRGTQFENYLKGGYFKKITDFQARKFSKSNVELFGKLYPTSSSIWINMSELFMEVKRQFFIVKGTALDNINSLKSEYNLATLECIRLDILKVLQFFVANIQELNLKCSSLSCTRDNGAVRSNLKNYLVKLLKEIKNLLLFVGQISSIPGIVNIQDFSNETSKSAIHFSHYYHLCLDIWYNCFSILYNLYFIIPSNTDINDIFCDDFTDHSSPILQLGSLLMYEFSSLAINRYKHANMYGNSPFLCPCISDFWIMLIHMLDKSTPFFESVSFWGIYQTILQTLLKNTFSVPENEGLIIDTFSITGVPLHKQSPIQACLWLTVHVASLYKYNTLGEFCDFREVKSGYTCGKYLIHNLLSSSAEAGEKNLRNALSYCVQLVKLWKPSCDMVLPLMDFFIKRIDETFSVQSSELKGLSYLFKDSPSWFTSVTNLSNSTTGKESSFDHFLCILHWQLLHDDDSSLWRSLKGRIYSKFIPKKIKEISEIGLQNTFSIFLAIAASGQFEISGKICEIASVMESAAYYRKQIISWKALFVLLFICQGKKQDLKHIISLISKFFNSAISDYVKVNRDSTHRTNLMNLLLIYMDSMNEVFKRSDTQDLSECELITTGFSDLIMGCGSTEMNYILGIYHNILQRFDGNSECNETQCIRTLTAVSSAIYPSVEKIAVTDTSPLVVSDIAFALTKLMCQFASTLLNYMEYNFHEIFLYFAGEKSVVNCTIMCRYLCLILNSPKLINELKLKSHINFDIITIQSWLRCTIYTERKCEYMDELTRKVLKSEILTEIIPALRTCNLEMGDHIKASIQFFGILGDAFRKSTQQQKIQMAHKVQQIFKKYSSVALDKIKKEKGDSSLRHVYKLISHLVEHCSSVLHLQVASNQVLQQLLDTTVYPQILFPGEKALQSRASNAIRDYLPHLMRGLFRLDYRRDKLIEREIRNISMYYICFFASLNNPFIKLLIDSVEQKPEGLSLDAYEFMLEVLKISVLSSSIEKPITLFEFYYEVFKRTPPKCKKQITDVLLKCALEIFMKQNDTLAEYLKDLVKKVLNYFKEKETKIILVPVVQWFITEKLQWSVVRGFNILNLFAECQPDVMCNILPFLSKSVETLESHRGLGEDMLLRNGLRNIVLKLQKRT